ncbi:hypothetical protein JOD54_004599 [Actinokineospora baliensis]|nr:hypothetical protein [Actinokineospora baliensis]
MPKQRINPRRRDRRSSNALTVVLFVIGQLIQLLIR